MDVRMPENFAGKVFPSFGEVDEDVDAVIDFSSPACLNGELEYCTARKVPRGDSRHGLYRGATEAQSKGPRRRPQCSAPPTFRWE